MDNNLAIKAREHFGLDNNVPILLYVGQINWKKNLERILESCSLLKKSDIKFKLVLAGKGPHVDELKQKAKELDIFDDVVLTGHILDEDLLSGLYALADMFVFPSLYDTYSMVVREAANAKTASVVVRGSAPAECIKDRENGMLCDDTSDSLYEVLKECLTNRDMLIRLGENAKKTIPVSWDVIMNQAVDRYKIVIENYRNNK